MVWQTMGNARIDSASRILHARKVKQRDLMRASLSELSLDQLTQQPYRKTTPPPTWRLIGSRLLPAGAGVNRRVTPQSRQSATERIVGRTPWPALEFLHFAPRDGGLQPARGL